MFYNIYEINMSSLYHLFSLFIPIYIIPILIWLFFIFGLIISKHFVVFPIYLNLHFIENEQNKT